MAVEELVVGTAAVPRDHPTGLAALRWQLRAARILLSGALRSLVEYRADVGFTLLAGLLYQTSSFLAVWVILARFDSILGWDLSQIALLYGIRITAHAVMVIPFSQLGWLSEHVREGTFDRYLLRPVNPLLQVMLTRVRLNSIGDLIGGVAILSTALATVDIDWTLWKVGFLALAILGGAALEVGIQVGMSAITIRAVKADEARFAVDWVFGLYGNYPAGMFGKVGQWLLVTVLPVGYVAYLPATVLLDRTDTLGGIPVALAWVSPLIGFLAAWFGCRVWFSQLRHYASTGN